jgi:hypothetical protein
MTSSRGAVVPVQTAPAGRTHRTGGQDGRMNVFTDYAETHWVPINGEVVTVQ